MTHDEMIAVLAAHRDGQVVQVRDNYSSGVMLSSAAGGVWKDYGGRCPGDFVNYDWRVKPDQVIETGVTIRGKKVYVAGTDGDAAALEREVDRANFGDVDLGHLQRERRRYLLEEVGGE